MQNSTIVILVLVCVALEVLSNEPYKSPVREDAYERQQKCGEAITTNVANIFNGTSTKRSEFPWHIAIYRLQRNKHVYKCGGTIINPFTIITAAHCLTDNKGLKYPAEEFYIGAGKYYSDYNSDKDISAQKRQVKEFHIPIDYKGYESNYAGDLAVVIVKEAFRKTNEVQPVCMDWNGTMESQQLQQNDIGTVVGWGFADPNSAKASEELKRLNVRFIELNQCLDDFSTMFRRYITLDKICTAPTTGPIICLGDGGGGLVFKWKNTQKYILRAVVSVGAVHQGTCDVSQPVMYTKISSYNTFIKNIINTKLINDDRIVFLD